MTIKELAYSAQQHIQVSTGNILKRTHIYELLAASFGFKSFAAFNTCALLVDAGIGVPMPGASPELVDRAIQLGYSEGISAAIAQSLIDHARVRQFSFIRLSDLLVILTPETRQKISDDDDAEDWETDLNDDQDEGGMAISIHQQTSKFLASSLLMDGLEHAALANNAEARAIGLKLLQ